MASKLLLLLLTSFSLLSAEEPWGKDASLHNYPYPQKEKESITPKIIAQLLIKFHQKVISPSDGPRSHFSPSSSEYAFQAISKYGFIKGFIMGCDRLQRENKDPWVYRTTIKYGKEIKYDPVP